MVLAEKAYSSRTIRSHLRKRGIRAVIPVPADQRGHRLRRGRLTTALADAGPSKLRDVAAWWTRLCAEDGEVIDSEIADGIVGDLAALVRSARRQNQSIYCWVA